MKAAEIEIKSVARGTEASAIADIVREGDMPHVLDSGDVVSIIVPPGATREQVDTEYLLDRPARRRGTVRLHTPESFRVFVVRHVDTDRTTIYANKDLHGFVAVLNDLTPTVVGDDESMLDRGAAEWADHRAFLTLRLTPEWKFWAEHDGQMMNQTDFATLIEDGQDEVREPNAATLLELAMTFHAKTNVKFRSAIVLQSGQRQLNYEEATEAGAGRDGKLEIPAEILLGISPFEGTEPYALRARLRYRLNNGALTIGYQLIRPHEVLDSAFEDAKSKIAEIDVPVFEGTPPEGVGR